MSWYNPFSWGEEDNNDAQEYLAQMEPMLHQYYDPYVEMGQRMMPTLEEQYSMLLNDPAAMQAMLGAGYTQSPGYQYQYDTAMNAGNSALAAGGMLGTPAAQTQMMGTAQGLASQDYWKYYGNNANLYGMGLEGTQGLFNTGYNASNELASSLANMYGSQANMAYANNQSNNNMFGTLAGAGLGALGDYFGSKGAKDSTKNDLLKTGATAAGTAMGGPAGGAAANMITGWLL